VEGSMCDHLRLVGCAALRAGWRVIGARGPQNSWLLTPRNAGVGVGWHRWLAAHLPVLPPCDWSDVSTCDWFCGDPLCYGQVWNALAIPTTLLYVAVMDPRYVILYSPDNVTVGPGERWPDIVVAQTGFQGAAEVYWNRSMSYRGGHNGDQVGARRKGMYNSDGAWGREGVT
jgi:hypothetical protein